MLVFVFGPEELINTDEQCLDMFKMCFQKDKGESAVAGPEIHAILSTVRLIQVVLTSGAAFNIK